ncbi:MAG: hypothetical protein FWB72_05360, partial [Firmicutes bacterium]|nr:hypothetical protein [Bacillota bacterium]
MRGLPKQIADILQVKGVDLDSAFFKGDEVVFVKSDIDSDNEYADTYIILSATRLFCIYGRYIHNYKRGGVSRSLGSKNPSIDFKYEIEGYKEFDLADIESLENQQFISTGRIIATLKCGDKQVLCYYTNTLQFDMEVFVRVCNKVLAGEPITKADFIDERG